MSKTILVVPPEWIAPNVPRRVLEIITLWNKCGARPFNFKNHHTKVFRSTITTIRQVIAGTFYEDKPGLTPWGGRRFSYDDFELSLDGFNLALSEEYQPWTKEYIAKTTLRSFFHNPHTDRIARSYFLWYLENKTLLRYPTPEQKEPRITERLMMHYRHEVLGVDGYKLPIQEEKCFIEASNRVYDLFHELRPRIFGGLRFPTPYEMADYLWESLRDSLDRFKPYWLKSEVTYTGLLRFLFSQSILHRDSTNRTTVGTLTPQDEDVTIPPELLH